MLGVAGDDGSAPSATTSARPLPTRCAWPVAAAAESAACASPAAALRGDRRPPLEPRAVPAPEILSGAPRRLSMGLGAALTEPLTPPVRAVRSLRRLIRSLLQASPSNAGQPPVRRAGLTGRSKHRWARPKDVLFCIYSAAPSPGSPLSAALAELSSGLAVSWGVT